MREEVSRDYPSRVCIVAFDSLDFQLIERYNSTNMKQKDFGKVDLTDFMRYRGMLSTPTIWTSFITGLPPEDHKVIGWTWSNPILDALKIWSIKLGLGRIFTRSKGLIRFVSRMTYENKYVPNIKGRVPTFFDYARNPVDIDVPCYSVDAYEEERRELTYGLGNPTVERKVVEKAWRTFKKKKEKVFDALKGDWDLLMVHFYLPDIVQHLLWYREEEIEKLYAEMDNTAKAIKKIVGESTFTLFISDHGQEKGLHTPNAFYSCNEKVDLLNPKITDFSDIVRRKLGAPSRREIEKVKGRLLELGYF